LFAKSDVVTLARDLVTLAYKVRNTSPSPTAGTATASAMDVAYSTAQKYLTEALAVTDLYEGLKIVDKIRALCSVVMSLDLKWKSEGGRASVVDAELAKQNAPKCGLTTPGVCLEQAGGVIFKWAVIGAAAYFGGRWVWRKLEEYPRKNLPGYARSSRWKGL
jgi:hypothetical protein